MILYKEKDPAGEGTSAGLPVGDDMTNLEFIKSLNAEQLEKFIFHTTHYMCLQYGKNAKEVWRLRCLSEKFRDEGGCERCRIDFLNSELGQLEEWREKLS